MWLLQKKVVKAAAGNGWSGSKVMTLLLKERGADVVITKEVVKAAATSGQEEVLKIFEKYLKVLPS